MFYSKWHAQTIKKVGVVSETKLYFRTLLFGLLVFGGCYAYTAWLGIPGTLNKAVADSGIVLIGLSMLLSSLCYFWDFVDSKIVYRKHLGLVGYAFALTHIALSFPALKALFQEQTWQRGAMWPALTAAIATVIFTIMALISNRYMAHELGGILWRRILRTGYIGIILVWLHVVLLKSGRWMSWFNDGMKTPPSLSLLVSLFMIFVIVMRIALWWSLKKKQALQKQNL